MTISILIAGQSNALGFGMSPSTLPAYYASFNYSNIYVRVNDNFWGGLQPGVNTGTPANPQAWGIEVPLAAALRQKFPSETILIQKSVKGETFLDDEPGMDWSAYSRGELYDQTSTRIAQGFTELGHPRPELLIWLQGEQDATRLDTAQAYGANLAAFLNSARTDWLTGDREVVVVQLPQALPYADIIREHQRMADAYLVPTLGGKLQPDSIHYDASLHVDVAHSIVSMWDSVFI